MIPFLVFVVFGDCFHFYCMPIEISLSKSVDPDQTPHFAESVQGPVVQSIISITSSFRGQLVQCFVTL